MPQNSRHFRATRDRVSSRTEDERLVRIRAVEEALETHKSNGYGIDVRIARLLRRFVDGELAAPNLLAELKRPYLH